MSCNFWAKSFPILGYTFAFVRKKIAQFNCNFAILPMKDLPILNNILPFFKTFANFVVAEV